MWSLLIQVPLFKQSCEGIATSFLIDIILLSIQVYLNYQKVRAWGSPSLGGTIIPMKCFLTGSLHARAPIHSYWFLHSKILTASSKGSIFFQINSCSVNVRRAWWLKKGLYLWTSKSMSQTTDPSNSKQKEHNKWKIIVYMNNPLSK